MVEHSVGGLGRFTISNLRRIFIMVGAFHYHRHRVLHTNPKKRIVAVFLVLGLEEEARLNDERFQCLE